MTPYESTIVTLLGMGVVFLGLLLCIAGIQVFNRLAKHITWGEEGHGHGGPAAAPESKETKAEVVDPVPMDPHLLAVIAAALEVDYRLTYGAGSQKLTIRRIAQS